MFSSDDEDHNECGHFEGASEDTSVRSHQIKKQLTDLGGPYSVELSKPYKPVYIVFLDLTFALTFFVFSVLWYWAKLSQDELIGRFYDFIPVRITVIWFILFVKFFFDIFYLTKRFGTDKLNRSEVTSYLFWFRIWYDIIFIGGILVVFTYIWKKKSN